MLTLEVLRSVEKVSKYPASGFECLRFALIEARRKGAPKLQQSQKEDSTYKRTLVTRVIMSQTFYNTQMTDCDCSHCRPLDFLDC